MQLTSCTKSLSPEDAIEVKPMLEKVFNAQAVFTMMEAINGKVKLGGACPEARQKHRFLDNYMTTALWKTFDDKHGIQNNLMAMATQMVNMGLDGKVAPLDEKTIAFASAIATRAAGFDAATLLGYNRDLKTYIVALTKMHTAPSLDGRRSTAPLDYPEETDEFRASWPELYTKAFPDEPAPSVYNNMQRQMLRELAPCRNTKARCQHLQPSLTRSKSHRAIVLPGFQQQQICNQGGSYAAHDEITLPGFRLCQPTNRPLPQQLVPRGVAFAPPRHALPPPALPSGEQRSPEHPSPLAVDEVATDSPGKLDDAEPKADNGGVLVASSTSGIRPAAPSAITKPVQRSMADITKSIQERLLGRPAKEVMPATKVISSKKPVMKASTSKRAHNKKGVMTNRASARKPMTAVKKPEMKSKKAELSYDELRFEKVENKNKPRFYGQVTIYTSKKLGKWRVKPERGSRRTFMISFTSNPRKAWTDVVKKVRELEKS